MTTQRWISFLILSLSLAMISLAWLTRPTFCLDSRLVEKIDIVGAQGTESVSACGVSKDNPFSASLVEIKGDLESRLRFLERTFDFMQVTVVPVRISIVDSLDPLIRVHPSHLILDRKAIESDQVLEKAILLSILLQKKGGTAASLTPDDVLWAEVFSDLYLSFETGFFSVNDPILNQIIQWKGRRIQWPYSVRTKGTYCLDGWRSFFHVSDCLSEEGPESLIVSLRPLLGSSMAEALHEMPVLDQVTWFRDVWNHWPQLQIKKFFFGSTVAAGEKQQLADAARGIENWMKNLRLWGTRGSSWKKMSSQLEKQLQVQGFRDNPGPLRADLVVIAGDASADWVMKSLRDATLVSSKKTILLLKGDEVFFLPDMKPFPRAWISEIKARQALMIQCATPSIEAFKDLHATVQKVMLIQTCQSPVNFSWTSVMQGKIEGFIRENPTLSFVQFDLQSLKSALARKNLNPIPFLAEGQWNSPFFVEIGWMIPTWDKNLKAYRTRAAIDAIETFRFQIPPAASETTTTL